MFGVYILKYCLQKCKRNTVGGIEAPLNRVRSTTTALTTYDTIENQKETWYLFPFVSILKLYMKFFFLMKNTLM